MNIKEEKLFIKNLKKYSENAFFADENAVWEGFEYFTTVEYKKKDGAITSRPKALISNNSIFELIKLLKAFSKRFPSVLMNIKRNFTDMDDYLRSLKNSEPVLTTSQELINSYPNHTIWEELKKFAWDNHRVVVKFTKLPKEYIFKGKAVPFQYALIFAQEMNKEAIEKAPKLDAGIEVVSVYNSLGIAVNVIANWLRTKHGIVCMANHPLGGLVDTAPLGNKAGLGAIGRHGLLITEEFGPRCRLAPIFLDKQIFELTDSDEHSWISDFCSTCGNCVKSCPTSAIYSDAKLSIKYNNDSIKNRYECYDREKCFISFSATMGCGVCISACPFSKNPNIYSRLKDRYKNNQGDKNAKQNIF